MVFAVFCMIHVHHELSLFNCFDPKDMEKERMDHCNKMGYSSGSPTLLAVKTS